MEGKLKCYEQEQPQQAECDITYYLEASVTPRLEKHRFLLHPEQSSVENKSE